MRRAYGGAPLMSPRQLAADILRRGLAHSTAKWLVLGSMAGCFSGLLGALFVGCSELLGHALLAKIAGFQPIQPRGEAPWFPHDQHTALDPMLLLGIMAAGGLVVGLLRRYLSYEPAIPTNYAVAAFHHNDGKVPFRHGLSAFLTAVITLGTGGCAGREGPTLVLAGGFSSGLGSRFQLNSRDRRLMLLAGMAGGIAAVFRAPLAGALFAVEVLYSDSDLEADALIPCFISAIVGFVVFGMTEGLMLDALGGGHQTSSLYDSLIHIRHSMEFRVADVVHLLGYGLVAVAVTATAFLFHGLMHSSSALVSRVPLPLWLKPCLGALGAGALALGLLSLCVRLGLVDTDSMAPLSVLGSGYGILQHAVDVAGDAGAAFDTAMLLLLIAGVKMLAAACTLTSGGGGGLFGPAMVVGGCVGGGIGYLLVAIAPGIAPTPAGAVVMGMAAILAAQYRTPVAGMLMVSELTGGYDLLLPAMWVCALSFLLSSRLKHNSSQVATTLHSPAHRGHFFTDILAGIKVQKVFDADRPVRTLHPESTIDACKQLVTDTNQNIYPVVGSDGQLRGLFSLDDLRSFLYDEALGLVAVAEDIATPDFEVITPKDSLSTAIRRFTERNSEELPVVVSNKDHTFLGFLSRREVIAHYNQVVDEMRSVKHEAGWGEHGPSGPRGGV